MVTELSPGSSANSKTSFPEGSNVRSISSYEYPSISSVSSFGSKSSTMSSPWDTDALFTNLKISEPNPPTKRSLSEVEVNTSSKLDPEITVLNA